MTPRLPLLSLATILGLGCVALPSAAPQIERRLEQTFTTDGNSVVVVRISGGPIVVETAASRSVQVTLEQRVEVNSDARADEVLENFEISAIEQGGTITVLARRHQDSSVGFRRNEPNVRFSATLTVPADVRLDLDTSGGAITVRGERTADVKADTSGGPIALDISRGAVDLDTSGGPIRVGRAFGNLRADTSGGNITVDYVGPAAAVVLLDTSGGNIRVGVDREARLDVRASTSGGNVRVDGLPFETETIRRNRADGRINGGGGRLTADTSGGNVDIHGVARP